MKLRFNCSKIGALLVFAAAWILAQNAGLAATLTVTPSAISNTYNGNITLQIGGLASGATVRIEKFMDVNSNGVVDAIDSLAQSFLLTDGLAATIGGVTNINVPGDYTPTNGAILTPVGFQAGGVVQELSGQYAYVLSSPTGQFTPVTNLFNVTNFNFAQSFTGTVLCGGTNVPYAGVMLFTPPSGDGGMEFIAGTLANSSGGYTVKAPAGTYMMMASKSGFIADLSVSPVVTLGSGATITTNLSLVAATQTVSGRVFDSANTNQGLPALMVICESSGGLAIGSTDTNGIFTVPVTAGMWSPGTDDRQVTFYGYLRLNSKAAAVNTTTGNVSGVSIALPKSTALIYGSVKDAQNNPLAGIGLYGNQDNGSGPYEGDATTDQDGNYVLGVVAGTWQASVDNNNPAFPGYIFSQMDNTNISAGQAVLHNFVGIAATNHITGFVRDGGGNPITNLNVYARADINSTTFNANANTDGSGAYSLTVANGTWYIGLDCNRLTTLGYQCISEMSTNILNADVVLNIIISTLQVATTDLPAATNSVFYSQQLNASGGQAPYRWSLSPGFTNLPDGLTLTTNGLLSGTPTGFDWFGFSVRVTDSQNATADQMLSLYINPAPLQITTTTLPNGTNGLYYDQPLNATGGQQPYNWYLPNGSMALPPGLNFSSNGVLSGTPTTNGAFNFQVAVYVTNPYYTARTQSLSLTIAPAPLLITTTSPLPTATRDSFYTTTLSASGGQPPYVWTLAPSSPSLPTGLSLSTNGVLSGTPVVSGGFWFVARVTDSVLAANESVLGLSINNVTNTPTVTLTAPSQAGAGRFQFSFSTAAGTNYTIQYSSDLQIWNSVLTISGSGSPLTVIDPNATVPHRFYRVKIGL